MIRKLGPDEVDAEVKRRVGDVVERMALDPNVGSTAERAYRRGWNDCLRNVLVEVASCR